MAKKANAQVKCQVPTKLHRRGQQRQPQPQLQVIVNQRKRRQVNAGISTSGGPLRLLALLGCLFGALSGAPGLTGQNVVQSDPRPTIYSGQVSFGLLLSAHSTLGTELTSSASQQIMTTMQVLDDETSTSASTQTTILVTGRANATTLSAELADEASESHERRHLAPIERRQIFDRSSYHVRRQKQQQQQQQPTQKPSQQVDPICGQVNPGALYAGMGAIWASHQANLVGDSQLSIGTYIYDSCNDLDVGQRQSVRIVSNLNAFQQTTCESPRGSPISITIAHGDNQLRAIQLLTSFRVPVVTTKEHFALEDYSQLSRDQRKFLFSTAASSRHLAVGALRFTKRVVSRSISSPKLPNQFHKLSSKNGLIVISRNLPAKFIVYLQETIPNHVNYEMLQSSQPIDQVRSLESLESILVKSGDSTGASHTSGASAATGTSESHPEPTFVQRLLAKRSTGDPSGELSGDSDNSGNSDEPAYEQEKHRMLSPTILMFITPAEAIDLITRLRNDLAEVSKYYSLIVSTREDISPALRTIFHRGGSRLCSGKAFYTISPVSEDISEFSRYFRDTVQMEGDSSDHPLVCDFAKFQASSKVNADLDDVATEPVIKAVWTAAAAFKSVYRRECSSLASLDSPPVTASTKHSRQSSQAANGQQQNNKSAHAECLVKMNKNMSNLVQKALRRLDVTINSTGLQALDGFRIKFDEMNELTTNKFSIKYINKECEIIEIGQFTGFKDSALRIDEDTLLKSLESTLPDAWPVTSPPAAVSPSGGSTSTTVSGSTTGASSSSSAAAAPTTTTTTTSSGGDSNAGDDATSDANGDASKSEEPSGKDDEPSGGSESADRSPSGGFESAMASQDSPKRRRSKQAQQPVEELRKRVSRLEAEGRRQQRRQHQLVGAPNAPIAPIAATTARGTTPGLTDSTETSKESPVATTTTTRQPNVRSRQQTTTGEPQPDQTTTQRNQMRKLKPFPNGLGVTLKDWLPKSNGAEPTTTTTRRPVLTDQTGQMNHNEHVEPTSDDLRMKGTTQAPIFSTLPESGGNTDLEMPTTRNSNAKEAPGRSLDTAASTTSDSSDYVTSPSIVQHQQHANNLMLAGQDTAGLHYLPTQMHNNNNSLLNQTHRSSGDLDGQLDAAVRVNYMHDINTSPTPLLTSTWRSLTGQPNYQEGLRLGSNAEQTDHKSGRSKLRWIYGSWFTLTILGANICGALLTLYVLTFLLMKNCDGSLDRENQSIRSMHLLAIIVVFFGSTLFIVYPTPGLCLLRTSWHNFAMVLIFSSLLLQTMQVRASGSLGLGGRPNRLNQFLTLLFMVGVQVSYELQRWRYESANYVNFVNQYFGSSENGDKKLMIFSSTIANQFNPLNSFNDQVTPVSIQVSEKYQSLLQDYCSQPADDFLQSQVYLCSIIGLLVVFSVSTRRIGRLATSAGPPTKAPPPISKVASAANATRQQHKLNSKSSNHHRHLHKRTGHFADLDSGQTASFASQFASNVATNSSSSAVIGNVFMVTLISAPIYFISVVLHVHGQSLASHDIIFSLAMVSIAFTTLIGIFMPILHQVNQRFDGGLITSTSSSSSSSSSSPGDPLRSGPTTASLTRRAIMSHQSMLNNNHHLNPSPTSSSAAFAMFPEFAPTGLRRPSSISGESSGGSRRPFADTKESRRNMSVNLANLGPSVDSLRHLGLSYNAAHHDHQEIAMNSRTKHDTSHLVDPGLLNLKLNLTADDEMSPMVDYDLYKASQGSTSRHNHHHHHHQQAKRSSSGEKRLIMLDVDPCCPRHGVAAWSTRNSANCSEGQPSAHYSKGCPGDQQLHYRPTDRAQ